MPGIEEYSPENNLFHKYELGKLLGCGAFAKVYHARNIITGQSVAVKVISKQKILKGGLTAHIKREISIMRRLHHPNIVKLYEVLATKTKIYFVIQFVKGGELFGKLSKVSRFSEDTSRRYFQQLISAIHYCHSHGVYHRDLKPENLLIDENGDLKVSDFGLSAVTEQVRQDGLLHTLCGTPAYVAPEILTKRGYDGAKIDIWSCGIILYVLNAGYLPFNDPNLMLMYRKIYKGEFRCPKWFSPDLRRFLSRLLDTNPQTRITVDEILHDPWFVKGYEDVRIEDETNYGAFFGPKTEEEDRKETFLTAFDLISFSSGFNLSNLFSDSYNLEESERIITSELADDIIDRIEEVANEENLRVTKKVWTLTLVGQDGNFVAVMEIYRLTESMFVVDVRSFSPVWKKLIRPKVFGSDYETK